MNRSLYFRILFALALILAAAPAPAAIQPRQLTVHKGANLYPTWLADSRHLVFSSGRNTLMGGFTLWTTSADTDTACQISWGDWNDGFSQLSPDGKSLLFMSTRAGDFSLYLRPLDLDTTLGVTDVSRINSFPHWFKDGRHIVYVSVYDSLAHLCIRDLPTGEERSIYESHSPIYFPTLDPAERTVYFSVGLSGIQYDMYRIPVEGGTAQLWNDFPGHKMRPIFTPDGRHVMFAKGNEQGLYELWVAPADSGRAAIRLDTGRPSAYYPAFSPDGKWLVFCSKDETGGVDLYVSPWREEDLPNR